MISIHDPVFVVGNERSGTTLLRLMLNEHPHLHVPNETHFIPPLIAKFGGDLVLTRADMDAAIEIITSDRDWQTWLRDEEIEESEVLDLLYGLPQPVLRTVVEALFEYSCKKAKKIRWGNKTPGYVSYIAEIHALFPAAKFIHIIRDPRDVCISMLRVGWHGNTVRQIASRWKNQVRTGMNAGRELAAGRYLEVLYEDLVVKSRPTLQVICDFLDEPYDEGMLEFYKGARQHQSFDLSNNEKLLRAPQSSDVSRWRTELNPLQIMVIENIAAAELREFDYELRYSGSSQLMPIVMGGVIWGAEATLPVRRRLGIRFPKLSGKL